MTRAPRLEAVVKSCKEARAALEPAQTPKGYLPAVRAGQCLQNAVQLLAEAAAELPQEQAVAFLAPVVDSLASHAEHLLKRLGS